MGQWEGSSWGIKGEENGLDTNFGGKIETEHEGSVGVGLEHAVHRTLQLYTLLHINHFIFFHKLQICVPLLQ